MKRNFTISGLFLFCLFFVSTAFAQNVTVKGKISDASTGESLPGVTVIVKGTTQGTQTDASGAFSLSVPPNASLQITYIGYATQTLTAGSGPITIKLSPVASDLQQVVVIGYGTQRKIDVTGSVSTVKGSEVAKEASQNALASLQGKVAGLQITNSGSPGASPNVTIRGLGSIYGKVNPLYVVDGVWYDDISFLNTNDIESVSVLKDASSTAIYGIRAANGVIIVTTKRGVKGAPVINYNGYAGWQAATNVVKMADATEYATAVNELVAINNTPAKTNPPVFADPASYGTGTNWYDQILRNAFVTNHELSVNGGTDKYTYNYSVGYLDQDGLVKTNNYQRYTAHLSNDIKVGKMLKFGFTGSGLFSKSKDADGGIFHELYGAAPTLPVFYADGKYGDPNDYHTGDGNNYNPEATIDFSNHHSRNTLLTGSVYGEFSFLDHFKFKSSLGGEVAQAEARNYVPVYYATFAQQSTSSSLDLSHTDTHNWIWENTLSYNLKINKHSITALAGYSTQSNTDYQLDGFAKNVPYAASGNLHTSFPSTDTVGYTRTYHSPLRSIGEFARVNYSYDDRYLLNASIRHDGASQFYGQGNQTYGYFPSVGAGWVITNESFMKNQQVFSNLKLRGSFGIVGNSGVPSNPTVVTVDNGQTLHYAFGNPLVVYQGLAIDQFAAPTIVWEKTQGTDFGIEGSILKNKLSFDADYYNRKTKDAIFPISIPGSAGAAGSNLLANQASIVNKGFEFTLNWADKVSSDFSYTIGGNLSINTNEVTNVESGKNPLYGGGNGIANGNLATRTVEGGPIGEFYGYKVIGIFQTAAQVANSLQTSAKPGDFIYQDTNHDGVLDSKDRVNLGNPNAKYTYGFNTSFTYKSFDLALDFQGVADVSVYNANIAYRYGNENFTQDFFEHRWHGAGTSNTYPSVNVGANSNAQPNSFYVESGAYFRVRNAQLGYTLPASVANRLKVQKVRFFANAQNPINIFGYKGFSPEVGGDVGNFGIDANVYPLYATFNFGVNVTLN